MAREGLHDFLLRIDKGLWQRFLLACGQERRSATQQFNFLAKEFVEKVEKRNDRKGK